MYKEKLSIGPLHIGSEQSVKQSEEYLNTLVSDTIISAVSSADASFVSNQTISVEASDYCTVNAHLYVRVGVNAKGYAQLHSTESLRNNVRDRLITKYNQALTGVSSLFTDQSTDLNRIISDTIKQYLNVKTLGQAMAAANVQQYIPAKCSGHGTINIDAVAIGTVMADAVAQANNDLVNKIISDTGTKIISDQSSDTSLLGSLGSMGSFNSSSGIGGVILIIMIIVIVLGATIALFKIYKSSKSKSPTTGGRNIWNNSQLLC